MSSGNLVPSQDGNLSKENRHLANFVPDVWGDTFLVPPPQLDMDDITRSEYQELKEQVRRMLNMDDNPSQKLDLIDAVQRLGVAYHFDKEIEDALQIIYHHHCNHVPVDDDDDLYTTAVRFRLLREHGFHVDSETFNKFKDEEGDFKESLICDVKGMLELYEAAHFQVHGENILEEALSFTNFHLKLAETKVDYPLSSQIANALNRPLRKSLTRLVFDGDTTQVNASNSNRAAASVQSDAELIGGLSSGDHEREIGLDVLLESEDVLVPAVTCELNSGVDQREFLEHGDGLNRDCLEQGVGLDALLEAEDTALPAETCELNSGDGFDVLPAETLDVLPAETCGFSNKDGQNDCSEESSRLSRVATVSENVCMRDSLARGDTECVLPMNIARLVVLYCWLVNEGQNHDNSFSTDQKQQGSVGNTQRVQRSETPMQTYNHVFQPLHQQMNSFPHFGQAQNFSSTPQVSYYPVQVVAPSGNNSTALFSPASQQVFSSVVPSSAVAGGYNNFAPLMGSVGVPTASISPQASIPSAPVSASFSPQSSAAFVPSSSTSVSVIPGETTWYPDSGATHHITNDSSNLHSGTVYRGNDSLLMGNGSGVAISHVGQGFLFTNSRPLVLQNMLHVPAIRKNLLSVSQLARENNVYFEFHPHGCCVKDVQSRATLLEGILTPEGLYKLGSRQDKVNTNIPLVTQNTSNVDKLVSDVFRVSNNQLSSQQRNDLVEAISSTENGSGRCVFDGDTTQVNASNSNRAAASVQSDAELIGGLSSGDHEREIGLDVLLESEDVLVPAVTCELNSGVDQREFLEHGDGLNRDCLEQGVGLDALLEAEDTALPAETCELNSGDGFDVLPAETLDVLPAETCGFFNEDGQNDCSEESSRLSRVATVSENVCMRDSLARGDTEQPLADDDDVVSADKRTMKRLSQVYNVEAKWLHENHIPTMEEYMPISLISCGYPSLTIVSLVGMEDTITKETFIWALNDPNILRASSTICRLIDDVVSHEFEQERKHVSSAVECYMKQYGTSMQATYEEFFNQIKDAWKEINEGFLRPTATPTSALNRIINLAKVMDLCHKGEDAYTLAGDSAETSITALLIDSISI
ncbi:hypothetical protein GQ457_06G022450 [Hibiscus cannabinus]